MILKLAAQHRGALIGIALALLALVGAGIYAAVVVHPDRPQALIAPHFTDHDPYEGVAGLDYNWQPDSIAGYPRARYTVSEGSLPPGLQLDPRKGGISGTALETGTYPFTIKADNGHTPADTTTVKITIVPPETDPAD